MYAGNIVYTVHHWLLITSFTKFNFAFHACLRRTIGKEITYCKNEEFWVGETWIAQGDIMAGDAIENVRSDASG